jgi:hypothetical protein
MNPWAAIQLAMLQKKLLDLGCDAGIFSAMLARLSVLPSIIATLRDFKGLAEKRDRVLLRVLRNEREDQSWLREKTPSAFFTISLSCRVISSSRLRRRSSSASGV